MGSCRILRELLRGGAITARHFFVNMAFHTLRLFGVRTKKRGAVTIQYPDERKELSPRQKMYKRSFMLFSRPKASMSCRWHLTMRCG